MRSVIRITSFIIILINLLTLGSCTKDPVPDPLPVVPDSTLATLTTTPVQSITQTSAVSGGNITSDGGHTVSARGICISINPDPTIADIIIPGGLGTGSFSCAIDNLAANKSYYIRAFATTDVGTAYGNRLSFSTSVDPNAAKLIFMGGSDSVYCFNAEDGSLKWKKQVGDRVGSITYANGRIFVQHYDDSSVPHPDMLDCYDTSGTFKWTVTFMNYQGFRPIAMGNLVYITTYDGFFAYDAITGAIQWQNPDPGTVINAISPTDNAIFLNPSLTTAGLTSFNAQTGAQNWNAPAADLTGNTAIADNKIYGWNFHNIEAYNTQTGANIFSVPATVVGTPKICVNGGSIYYNVTGLSIPTLESRNISNGDLKWSIANYELWSSDNTVQVENNKLVIAHEATVFIYDAITGNAIGSFSNGGQADLEADVSLVNNTVYMGFERNGDPGLLMALDLNTNDLKWISTENSNYNTIPCVVTFAGKMYRGGDIY